MTQNICTIGKIIKLNDVISIFCLVTEYIMSWFSLQYYIILLQDILYIKAITHFIVSKISHSNYLKSSIMQVFHLCSKKLNVCARSCHIISYIMICNQRNRVYCTISIIIIIRLAIYNLHKVIEYSSAIVIKFRIFGIMVPFSDGISICVSNTTVIKICSAICLMSWTSN